MLLSILLGFLLAIVTVAHPTDNSISIKDTTASSNLNLPDGVSVLSPEEASQAITPVKYHDALTRRQGGPNGDHCGIIIYRLSATYFDLWKNDKCIDLYDPGARVVIDSEKCKDCHFWSSHDCKGDDVTLVTHTKGEWRVRDTYSFFCF